MNNHDQRRFCSKGCANRPLLRCHALHRSGRQFFVADFKRFWDPRSHGRGNSTASDAEQQGAPHNTAPLCCETAARRRIRCAPQARHFVALCGQRAVSYEVSLKRACGSACSVISRILGSSRRYRSESVEQNDRGCEIKGPALITCLEGFIGKSSSRASCPDPALP